MIGRGRAPLGLAAVLLAAALSAASLLARRPAAAPPLRAFYVGWLPSLVAVDGRAGHVLLAATSRLDSGLTALAPLAAPAAVIDPAVYVRDAASGAALRPIRPAHAAGFGYPRALAVDERTGQVVLAQARDPFGAVSIVVPATGDTSRPQSAWFAMRPQSQAP